MYDVEYRIVVSCRNGNIYTIKKGKVLSAVCYLLSAACCLLYAVCCSMSVVCYLQSAV
jgi:hypothetical protein